MAIFYLQVDQNDWPFRQETLIIRLATPATITDAPAASQPLLRSVEKQLASPFSGECRSFNYRLGVILAHCRIRAVPLSSCDESALPA